eukprot:3317765-Rhodomonas_salina.1
MRATAKPVSPQRMSAIPRLSRKSARFPRWNSTPCTSANTTTIPTRNDSIGAYGRVLKVSATLTAHAKMTMAKRKSRTMRRLPSFFHRGMSS